MSSEKVYLTKEEQIYLMEMFEVDNPTDAAENFVRLMVEVGVDPVELKSYLRKVMSRPVKL